MSDALTELSMAGVAIWLDDLSRQRLTNPNDPASLAKLRDDYRVVGVTTNPTIFANALDGSSQAYTETLRQLAASGASADEAIRAITTSDVRDACDQLKDVFDRTEGLDGRVSIEVDPRKASDTEGTIEEATALATEVGRENLFIKIPATPEGLPAITEVLARGISVNVTLIFSLQRYAEVMAAFLAGLEEASTRGHDVGKISSVASFFVSRVDSEIDRRLDTLIEATKGREDGHHPLAVSSFDPSLAIQLRGQAAIANARLAYQRYEQVFTGKRWYPLAQLGAKPQRPLWASTGVKDPSYDDTRYVTELVAPNTVNTMPEKTLRAVADHGQIRGNTVTPLYDEAEEVLAELERLGVDYDDVVTTLEAEGVRKFIDSWEDLRSSVSRQLEALRP